MTARDSAAAVMRPARTVCGLLLKRHASRQSFDAPRRSAAPPPSLQSLTLAACERALGSENALRLEWRADRWPDECGNFLKSRGLVVAPHSSLQALGLLWPLRLPHIQRVNCSCSLFVGECLLLCLTAAAFFFFFFSPAGLLFLELVFLIFSPHSLILLAYLAMIASLPAEEYFASFRKLVLSYADGDFVAPLFLSTPTWSALD